MTSDQTIERTTMTSDQTTEEIGAVTSVTTAPAGMVRIEDCHERVRLCVAVERVAVIVGTTTETGGTRLHALTPNELGRSVVEWMLGPLRVEIGPSHLEMVDSWEAGEERARRRLLEAVRGGHPFVHYLRHQYLPVRRWGAEDSDIGRTEFVAQHDPRCATCEAETDTPQALIRATIRANLDSWYAEHPEAVRTGEPIHVATDKDLNALTYGQSLEYALQHAHVYTDPACLFGSLPGAQGVPLLEIDRVARIVVASLRDSLDEHQLERLDRAPTDPSSFGDGTDPWSTPAPAF